MLFSVPIGKSFFGCGTVVIPGRVPWMKCQWLPVVRV